MKPVSDSDFQGFEWDEPKSTLTLERRGIDFTTAAKIFAGFFIKWEDRRRDYGEQRFLTVGEANGFVITVAWTPRERNRRIITAWPASDQERRIYREHRAIHERRNPQA
jgi:uncharacterized protein